VAGPSGLEQLLDAAGQGVLVLDEQDRTTHASARIEELFGYRADELLGQSVERLVPLQLRDLLAGYRATCEAAPCGGSLSPARGRRKDGTGLSIEVDLGLARTAEGCRVLALVRDVTADRLAEQRLQAEFAVTRAFVEASSLREATPRLLGALGECLGLEVGELWSVEPDGHVLRREGAWALPGVDIAELEAAAPDMAFTAGVGLPGRVWLTGRPEWVSDVREEPQFRRQTVAARVGLRAACAFPVVHGAATIGAMLYFSREVRPPDAAMLELVADIGNRVGQYIVSKRAQQDLARQRQALARQEKLAGLGRLVAGVVHELNNPLGIVSSRAELLLGDAERAGLSPEAVGDLRVVHRNVQRATAITQALMTFARQAPLEPRPVDVNDVVEDTLARSAEAFTAGRVSVERALDRTIPGVLGDPYALAQALRAVLKNACEALPDGGRVTVVTGREPGRPDWIRLRVADTGLGIPIDALPRLFEPFHTTKPRAPGLGLAVAYGIVRDHGGQIEVESASAGGTTVVITLPAETPAPEQRR
jgi:PAS domain S-box-containing protein